MPVKDRLLLFAHAVERGFTPFGDLQHVGHEVAVREHRTFGHACGAAGILQKAKSSCVKVTGVMARFWLSANTCLNEMALSIFHAGIIF